MALQETTRALADPIRRTILNLLKKIKFFNLNVNSLYGYTFRLSFFFLSKYNKSHLKC